MQCKKSQNHDLLRKLFENIVILKERSMNILKSLLKQKHEDNKVIMTKGIELTLKLSTDMISTSRKLFVETLPPGFLTQNTKEEVLAA
jgi:hypothetical protein